MSKRRSYRRRNPINLTGGGVLSVALLAALAFAGVMVYKNRAAIAAKLKTAFNPASTENIAYGGATSIMQAATGNKVDSFGTWLGEIFKSPAEKKVDEMLKTSPAVVTDAQMAQGSYYDLGQKVVPIGAARVINTAGTMTDSSYRDLIR